MLKLLPTLPASQELPNVLEGNWVVLRGGMNNLVSGHHGLLFKAAFSITLLFFLAKINFASGGNFKMCNESSQNSKDTVGVL